MSLPHALFARGAGVTAALLLFCTVSAAASPELQGRSPGQPLHRVSTVSQNGKTVTVVDDWVGDAAR